MLNKTQINALSSEFVNRVGYDVKSLINYAIEKNTKFISKEFDGLFPLKDL